jgi:nitrile hydratase accessory protein
VSAPDDSLQVRLDLPGAAAPPMENGELVFEAPWQARVFGMAHRLCDAGCYSWDEFRERLIDEIARWEAAAPTGAPYAYYERFLAALETLLADKEIASAEVLASLRATLAARPQDHDHPH